MLPHTRSALATITTVPVRSNNATVVELGSNGWWRLVSWLLQEWTPFNVTQFLSQSKAANGDFWSTLPKRFLKKKPEIVCSYEKKHDKSSKLFFCKTTTRQIDQQCGICAVCYIILWTRFRGRNTNIGAGQLCIWLHHCRNVNVNRGLVQNHEASPLRCAFHNSQIISRCHVVSTKTVEITPKSSSS